MTCAPCCGWRAGARRKPTAAIIDSRTLRSTPVSGTRAGHDGAKRKRGSKLHMAVDTLGHLLALHVTPASVDDRAEVGRLAEAIQDATGQSVTLAPSSADRRRGSSDAGQRTPRSGTVRAWVWRPDAGLPAPREPRPNKQPGNHMTLLNETRVQA
jgi:hypothetical protein